MQLGLGLGLEAIGHRYERFMQRDRLALGHLLEPGIALWVWKRKGRIASIAGGEPEMMDEM